MSTTVVDHIGLLVTNDPTLGEGPLGLVRDAAVVIEGEKIIAVVSSGAAADFRIDVAGRCVVPGFVDSHTHLVFAGDRADEFLARMGGQPYSPGGIHRTVEATRSAGDLTLYAQTSRLLREAVSSGTTTIEIKSGYGLNVRDEVRCLRIAREITQETTFLGAHVVPAEFQGRESAYLDLVCGEMLAAVRPHARWVDAFCEKGAFDVEQCRRVLSAGRTAGLEARLHANQLGHGPGVQLAVELDCASADHCTYLSDDDIAALAGSNTVATFLPVTDFCSRGPYANARRAIDAGVKVAIATNCNPGSSYTTSMSFCIALAVREMGMTIDEAFLSATLGGAKALRRPDIGRITPGCRADLLILEAPSYTHLAYRPGASIVRQVLVAGTSQREGSGPQ